MFRQQGALPGVAGEQENLPLPPQLLQQFQGQGAAAVVKVGQGVIQHQGQGSSPGSTSPHTARRTAR